MAAAKIVNLQTLIKHDIVPESSSRVLDCDKIVQLPKIQLSEVNSLTSSLLKTLKNSWGLMIPLSIKLFICRIPCL